MGIRVRDGEGAPAGSYKAGSFWAGAGSLAAWAAAARSLPTVGRRGGGREGQADRWSGRAGPGRGRFGGPCRAARQAELAAQARPGARAVLGPGPVTSGPAVLGPCRVVRARAGLTGLGTYAHLYPQCFPVVRFLNGGPGKERTTAMRARTVRQVSWWPALLRMQHQLLLLRRPDQSNHTDKTFQFTADRCASSIHHPWRIGDVESFQTQVVLRSVLRRTES